MDRMLIWLGLGLIGMGILIAALGFFLGAVGARGGRLLPGDIVISRPSFTFVFPLATSILASVALTLILWLVAALRR
jgi:hypothetical protein